MLQENMSHEEKFTAFIPFSILPESRHWDIGKTYRVKAVLRQTNTSEDGATFELVDVNSLETDDSSSRKRIYLADGGLVRG